MNASMSATGQTVKFADGQEWIVITRQKINDVWRPVYADGWRRIDDESCARRSHAECLAKMAEDRVSFADVSADAMNDWYEETVGYRPQADSPSMTDSELRDLCQGYLVAFAEATAEE